MNGPVYTTELKILEMGQSSNYIVEQIAPDSQAEMYQLSPVPLSNPPSYQLMQWKYHAENLAV